MNWSTLESPIGELTIVAHDSVLVGLYLPGHQPAPNPSTFGDRVDEALPAASEQLKEYFLGQRRVFDLPLAMRGTNFQQSVWAGLRLIPYGETRSYGELAATIGRPGAQRAVGLANGRNPICIVVPCHRIVGADGKLGGYAGGAHRKAALLALETGQR